MWRGRVWGWGHPDEATTLFLDSMEAPASPRSALPALADSGVRGRLGLPVTLGGTGGLIARTSELQERRGTKADRVIAQRGAHISKSHPRGALWGCGRAGTLPQSLDSPASDGDTATSSRK